jgi:hypothetical protein
MKKNHILIINIMAAVVLSIVLAASAFAGESAVETNQYESAQGELSIKEGHGDFLVRLSDGRAQRFSVRGNEAEIIRNGSPARYSELKVSDSVQVKYNATNRKVIVIHAKGS